MTSLPLHHATGNGAPGPSELHLDEPPPPGSHDAIADLMANRCRDRLRYCAAFGGWMVYEAGRWQRDETLLGFNLARECCRVFAATCNEPAHVKRALTSGSTVAAVEKLARADRRLAATHDQWDADPLLLNTPSGVVDLRTGEMRPGRPDDYCTKITAVAPATPGTVPTRWLDFLDTITERDEELVSYLQRLFGYGLTGETKEHAFFFAYGTGANGKSVLLNTCLGILGNYGRTAPMETFVATNGDRHPTDIAMLRGARLVVATETEGGQRWAESRIKTITGGDVVAARFMRGDFFEYRPTFKLLFAGNHKPGLRAVDEAMRRRLHLIPFRVTISADQRDPDLAEKLRDEWPAILRWAIDGCVAWQRLRLSPPPTVRSATDEYMAAQDAFGLWAADACDTSPHAWETASALYASFKAWAAAAGEHIPSQKSFSQALEARGHRKEHRRNGTGYYGLQLRVAQADDAYWTR